MQGFGRPDSAWRAVTLDRSRRPGKDATVRVGGRTYFLEAGMDALFFRPKFLAVLVVAGAALIYFGVTGDSWLIAAGMLVWAVMAFGIYMATQASKRRGQANAGPGGQVHYGTAGAQGQPQPGTGAPSPTRALCSTARRPTRCSLVCHSLGRRTTRKVSTAQHPPTPGRPPVMPRKPRIRTPTSSHRRSSLAARPSSETCLRPGSAGGVSSKTFGGGSG